LSSHEAGPFERQHHLMNPEGGLTRKYSCMSASAGGRRCRPVLNLIMQGKSNKEIARSLKLAEGTVKIHVDGLFSKLGGVWGRARPAGRV
jgi:DNA-binding NarL/FixJ family response regulator